MRHSPVQLLPYPAGLDGANGGRQIQDLAETLEARFNRLNAEWFDRNSPWGWQVRTTASQGSFAGSSVPLSWHAVDFDNHGALAPVNSGTASRGVLGASGRWETWYFGAYLNFAGGTTLDAATYVALIVENIDPVTNVLSTQTFEHMGVWSNTAGEHVVVDAYARVRAATVRVQQASDGSGTKTIAVGASFWACRVGVE